MNLFQRKAKENRTIEEILTPKNADEDIITADDSLEEEHDNSQSQTNVRANVPINPLSCFGMEEERTEKWLLKCVKFWYCLMSFLWFLFGAVTFAPVIYISSKIEPISKNKNMSFAIGALSYSVLVFLLILLF